MLHLGEWPDGTAPLTRHSLWFIEDGEALGGGSRTAQRRCLLARQIHLPLQDAGCLGPGLGGLLNAPSYNRSSRAGRAGTSPKRMAPEERGEAGQCLAPDLRGV